MPDQEQHDQHDQHEQHDDQHEQPQAETALGAMAVHPAAAIFPLMDETSLAELTESIRENGQRVPIVVHEGQILDGRNRWLACRRIGVTPKTIEWDGVGSPWQFVWDHNGTRRELPAAQRAAIYVKLLRADADWQQAEAERRQRANETRSAAKKAAVLGQPRGADGTLGPALVPSAGPNDPALGGAEPTSAPEPERERDRLAAACGVSPTTAKRLLALEHARPDLLEQIAAGTISETEAGRIARRDQVATRTAALPTGRYRVIYADPPWQYRDTRAGLAGYAASAAADHYPTLSVAELSALDVGALAEDDAVLFCWATCPLLPDALAVIKAWGFAWKTFFVWAKRRPNFGHYHNASAEVLIVATRGSCLPDTGTREDQVQAVERTGRHSEKPEHFRHLIDHLYPHGRRIELFRRGDAPDGWDTWGNEAERPGSSAARGRPSLLGII